MFEQSCIVGSGNLFYCWSQHVNAWHSYNKYFTHFKQKFPNEKQGNSLGLALVERNGAPGGLGERLLQPGEVIHLGMWKVRSQEVVTLVKAAQGAAEMKLKSQMARMTLLASPVEDRASGERGRHIARYLCQVSGVRCQVSGVTSPR